MLFFETLEPLELEESPRLRGLSAAGSDVGRRFLMRRDVDEGRWKCESSRCGGLQSKVNMVSCVNAVHDATRSMQR